VIFGYSEMAFGSWLKGIYGKAKELITQYAPVVKQVIDYVAPVLGQLGGVLGGTAGAVLSKIGTGMGNVSAFGDVVSGTVFDGARGASRSGRALHKKDRLFTTFGDTFGAGSRAGPSNITPRFK